MQFSGTWYRYSSELHWLKMIEYQYVHSVTNKDNLPMLDTFKIWLGLVNSCAYYARHTREIYQVLPYSVDSKTPEELWSPPRETVLSEYSFVQNKGNATIWNDASSKVTCASDLWIFFIIFDTVVIRVKASKMVCVIEPLCQLQVWNHAHLDKELFVIYIYIYIYM